MSSPRAATSVATSTLKRPWRKRCSVRSRCACAMSPCSTSVDMRRPSAAVTSSASRLVWQKQIALLPLANTVTRSARMVLRLAGEHAQLMTSMSGLSFCWLSPTRSMFTCSRRYFCVRRSTQLGMVAENRNVWRCSGISCMMRSTSSSNPTASIWSASSRMQYSIWSSCRLPRLMRSMRRPGVPTTMSTPRRRSRSWLAMAAPPYTHSVLRLGEVACISFSTCMASSRVGASTMQRGRRLARSWGLFWSPSMTGRAKPRVLPVPVRARPTMSRPAMAGASTADWMGNSTSMPRLRSAALVMADSGKLSMWLGSFSAVGLASPSSSMSSSSSSLS
mmetsp:Transcript_17647/g.43608  ORF Transcript_17647/g.43608 Transcript_17647/m.43608 type:complete len:334 (-) Transcript_17647:392-1393(-)